MQGKHLKRAIGLYEHADAAELVERFQGKPGALLGVLEALQNGSPGSYLSGDTLEQVADLMRIPLSQVYSVVTFYSNFNLEPQGRHSITVCRGTACHTRGSLQLLHEALKELGYCGTGDSDWTGYTTPDKLFTVKTVACFGQCAFSPVIMVDETMYSRVNVCDICAIIDSVRKEEQT